MSERLIIIGSGPAGLTAAIYTSRANINPLLIEGFQEGGIPGGQLMITSVVENFPGFPEGIMGPHLMGQMREQAIKHGTRMMMDDITDVDLKKHPFTLTTAGGETHFAEALIIASGAVARRLPIESEQRFWGRGISACAVCDGALPIFRNRELAVIGGGDTAIEEALHLTQFASKVYLIHRRDALRASSVMQKRIKTHPKVEILWNKTIEEFCGDSKLSCLRLKDTVTGARSDLPVIGAFEAIGHVPNTGFLKGQIDVSENGYLKTISGSTRTNIAGVFAAGDVQDANFRQAITAAGSGCMAAIEAERWLQERACAFQLTCEPETGGRITSTPIQTSSYLTVLI